MKSLHDYRADATDYLDMVLLPKFISSVFNNVSDISLAAETARITRMAQPSNLVDSAFTEELQQMWIRWEVKEIQLLEKLGKAKKSLSIIRELCLCLELHLESRYLLMVSVDRWKLLLLDSQVPLKSQELHQPKLIFWHLHFHFSITGKIFFPPAFLLLRLTHFQKAPVSQPFNMWWN